MAQLAKKTNEIIFQPSKHTYCTALVKKHVLRVYNLLSIHGWSEVKPAENEDVIYEQTLMSVL